MADSPAPDPAGSQPATRADLAGLAHQMRTEMVHLRRDLAARLDVAAARLDAAGGRLDEALGRRHTRLVLALLAAQCAVTAVLAAVLRVAA